ncbi:alpha-tocopherol transfer protein-like [Culicoides brevitarsis]|uniref:alpha-tocopherol transfer protein-like n=1 Tax=Culicoides brevitarsis TaxID=469753 RepID=UPI00307C3A2C
MSLQMEFDLNEALKREEVEQDVLDKLRKSDIPSMPDSITDQLLLLFYCACEKDFEVTKQVIKNYYEHKPNALEHFSKRDPDSAKIKQCLQNQMYFYLPVTPNGYAVLYHKLSNSKAGNYMFDEAIKTYLMAIDSCLYTQGPRKGIIFLFDMKNVTLAHLTRISIRGIRKFFFYVQECLPAKLEEIHIINTVGFIDKVLSLIKPFLKADILKKLYMHSATEDYHTLLKDKIPLSCLPSDFGGELDSCEKMHEKHCKELLQMRDFFLNEEKQWNPSASNNNNNNVIEAAENFSKLDID